MNKKKKFNIYTHSIRLGWRPLEVTRLFRWPVECAHGTQLVHACSYAQCRSLPSATQCQNSEALRCQHSRCYKITTQKYISNAFNIKKARTLTNPRHFTEYAPEWGTKCSNQWYTSAGVITPEPCFNI